MMQEIHIHSEVKIKRKSFATVGNANERYFVRLMFTSIGPTVVRKFLAE